MCTLCGSPHHTRSACPWDKALTTTWHNLLRLSYQWGRPASYKGPKR
jgi:hypothetical protein